MALALTTFPVIWVGGLVTTYEAGMAVPDWPNTYGYNLLLYPWQTWLFGPWDLFVEHGHRLLASTAGLLTIALVISIWRCEQRRGLRWLAVAALAGVCLQGALGGMRVLLDERVLARLHGCLGPAFFALTVAIALLTSRNWQRGADRQVDASAGKVQRLALLTTALAYLQLVIGAHLRHPSTDWAPSVFQTIVVFHLAVAAAIAAHAGLLAARAWRLPAIWHGSLCLAALVALQLALGTLTWLENYGWPAGAETYQVAAGHTVAAQSQMQTLVTTAHVATGALIVAVALVVTMQSFHELRQSVVAGAGAPRQVARGAARQLAVAGRMLA